MKSRIEANAGWILETAIISSEKISLLIPVWNEAFSSRLPICVVQEGFL
jgi:hypothetical protein